MRNSRPLIYLAGPIHGQTSAESRAWRVTATRLLAPEFGVLSPMRGKEWAGVDYSKYTDHEIIGRDLQDIARAHAVLRYIPDGPTEGSAMETFFAAHNHGIPVVTFGPGQSNRSKLSLWLRHHTVRNFETLHEAVEYLKTMWLPPDDGIPAPAPAAADDSTVIPFPRPAAQKRCPQSLAA